MTTTGELWTEPAALVAVRTYVPASVSVAARLIELEAVLDGNLITRYRSDGLIVGTPTGSTAYTLAAGGPIVTPDVRAVVVTPICPQGLAHRPLVLHPDAKIELAITSSGGLTTLVVDGQGYAPMRQGDSVFIERHPVAYPLLGWAKLDPYRRLRERLGWSGTVEPLSGEAAGEARGIASARHSNDDDLGL